MRFLLINPYYPISETPSPPLGLAFLASSLEAAGVEVELLDLVVYPNSRESIEGVLNRFKPHVVGATAVTMNVDQAIQVIRDIKSMAPDIFTVMGGPHVTFCARETMMACREIDFIVLGEGEETIVELANALEDRSRWEAIRGLVYRDDEHIRTTQPRPFIENIDSLPEPARRLIPLGRYRALGLPVSMITSRGCPFQCIFCVGRKMVGAKVRYRRPENVVKELAYLGSLDFHQVNIADDLFTASKRHCMAVCNEIIKRRLKIKWTSFARVDTVSYPVLERMKEAGCTAISFGVETGSPKILKTIRKGITLHQVLEAVKMCNDTGITPQASFILGLPGETPDTIKETVRFAAKLKEMGVMHGYHLLAPFPGTDVREKQRSYDIEIVSNDWRDYHANRAIVRTSTVNEKMLDDIVKDWQDQFDSWLNDIKKRREDGTVSEKEAWPLTKLEHTIVIYDLMMQEAIERMGTLRRAISPAEKDAILALCKRIEGTVEHSSQQVLKTLRFASEHSYLASYKKNEEVRWKWIDYL